MIVAFDTYYYEGYSYTVGGVFESWSSSEVSYYVTSKRDCIDAEYKSRELYKRELPCIMQCLSLLNLETIDTIIVDGYAWLSDDGKELVKGLGARLYDNIKMVYGVDKEIVGIAKNPYHVKIPNCFEVRHGVESEKPLFVTCSNADYAEYYSVLVGRMDGEYRIPTILKNVDTKSRELGHTDEVKETKPIEIDFGSFDELVAESEKRGFRVL